jgi:hypothetical protein
VIQIDRDQRLHNANIQLDGGKEHSQRNASATDLGHLQQAQAAELAIHLKTGSPEEHVLGDACHVGRSLGAAWTKRPSPRRINSTRVPARSVAMQSGKWFTCGGSLRPWVVMPQPV